MPTKLVLTTFVILIIPTLMGLRNYGLFSSNENRMDIEKLESIVKKHSDYYDGESGYLQFTNHGLRLACITDTAFNRMRIITPVVTTQYLDKKHLVYMLEANFHSALDARYATSQGMLFAAFIHPLDSLTEEEVISAIEQVTSLALTFGSSYSAVEIEESFKN